MTVTKNRFPLTACVRVRPSALSVEAMSATSATWRANNSAESTMPTETPRARLCVQTTVPTVTTITSVSVTGIVRTPASDDQSNVPTDTMTMTATSAPIGIRTSQSARTRMKKSRNAPAANVDSRPRPPDFTLITDCPIMAHPAIPPNRPDTMFATPCPRLSRSLSEVVSVISSTIDAVRSDSIRPTSASASATGPMIARVSRFSGTDGSPNAGSAVGSAPMSPTVISPPPANTVTTVSPTMATRGDGTAVVRRGSP